MRPNWRYPRSARLLQAAARLEELDGYLRELKSDVDARDAALTAAVYIKVVQEDAQRLRRHLEVLGRELQAIERRREG